MNGIVSSLISDQLRPIVFLLGITLFKKVCNDVDSYYYTDGGKETIIKEKMYNTLLKLM